MYNNIYNGKIVLVTGHTGFKGSWLCIWLLKLGARVVGISNNVPTNPSLYETANLKDQITDLRIDIRDLPLLQSQIIQINPDFIFHLAAQPIVSTAIYNPIETFSTNVMGTINILESARYLKKKCVCILITSDKCYDNVEWEWGYKETDVLGGKDIYSGSKGAAELAAKCYFHTYFKDNEYIKLATVRAGNVIGGGDWAKDRIIPDCMKAWNNNSFVEIRCPDATRPWQHVLEPLSGYLLLAEKLYNNNINSGEAFNFGPKAEQNRTVLDLINGLAKSWKFINDNVPYKITANIPFHEAGLLKLNCDKALFSLKWESNLSYEETIKFVGDWYFEYFKGENNIFDFTFNQITEYETLAKNRKKIWIT